jgi:hypothetical protein
MNVCGMRRSCDMNEQNLPKKTEFPLKYQAVIGGFISGVRISYCLFCSIILLYANSASAFFSDDRIDDNFSYRSLHVEILKTKTKRKSKTKHDGCYLVGEILNKTNVTQEGVSVTFYAYDFFDHTLWKQTIHIDIIDPYYNSRKGHAFQKKLPSCEEPAKFQFKVTGVKKKDTKKVIPDKPKSKTKSKPKDPESMHSRQKDDSGADVISGAATPVVTIQNYLIILTNGKEISTESYREQDNMLFFKKGGGEVRINKDKISEIRKLN